MKLCIRIKKEHNKDSTLSCLRQDGSVTYAKLQRNFEIHDIAHYAVEKNLQFKNAFYGLLLQGYQINDFMLPKEQRPEALQSKNLPYEALVTEHLVNLLTIDYLNEQTNMELLDTLKEILQKNSLPFPKELNSDKLSRIQEELALLMTTWENTGTGFYLEMDFEI